MQSPKSFEPWLTLGILSHLAIALAFLGIAVIVTPRFRFFTLSKLGAAVARASGALFLAFSALTHVELSVQAITFGVSSPRNPNGVGRWFVQWHGVLVGTGEAVVAWTFLLLTVHFLSVNVVSKALLAEAVDARIAEISRQISESEGG